MKGNSRFSKPTAGVLALAMLLAGCGAGPADGNAALGGKVGDGPKIDAVPAATTPVSDGPFGIAVGTPLDRLDKRAERDSETGISMLSNAPTPSSQFPGVAVVSFPETGVCEVRAMSEEFDSDSYITASTAFADEVASALESRYGKGKLDSGCSGYSCSSEYKLQAIQSGSRWYGYKWEVSKEHPFPNHVKTISLWVNHTRFNDSQVRLDYVFDNDEACARAAKSAKASKL